MHCPAGSRRCACWECFQAEIGRRRIRLHGLLAFAHEVCAELWMFHGWVPAARVAGVLDLRSGANVLRICAKDRYGTPTALLYAGQWVRSGARGQCGVDGGAVGC